jgi:hypothetical protein
MALEEVEFGRIEEAPEAGFVQIQSKETFVLHAYVYALARKQEVITVPRDNAVGGGIFGDGKVGQVGFSVDW